MTISNAWIDKAESLSRGFREETPGAMMNRPHRIKEIISGIILLAARDKEPMPTAKVHSILHAMKSHESILSGLRFSLTGAVCYSRDIDQAIHHLTDGGFLKIVDGSAFAVEHASEFGSHLSGFLTNSQIQAVHSASLRFHERMRRDAKDPHDRP
ncbi:MAG: hypothetical protein ACXW4F_10560 [Candidatus Deferrimicrobiaceae bacterium]